MSESTLTTADLLIEEAIRTGLRQQEALSESYISLDERIDFSALARAVIDALYGNCYQILPCEVVHQ